jgi:Rab family protein
MNSSSEDYDYLYKIVLVGDAGVGKTHLLSRYVKGSLPKNPTSTIGVEFATRTVPLLTGGTVRAQIWDTAGQERYKSITSAHYRRSIGALLVYDVTNEKSFINAAKWLDDLRENAEPDIIIMLVGNKTDLCEKNPNCRKVPTETARVFAQSHSMLFEETSAVTVSRVREAFENLLQEIYNFRSRTVKQRSPSESIGHILIPKIEEKKYLNCCTGI